MESMVDMDVEDMESGFFFGRQPVLKKRSKSREVIGSL